MKKLLSLMASILILISFVACQSENNTDEIEEPVSESPIVSDTSQNDETEAVESNQRKVHMTIDGQEYEITLFDNPVADELYDLLPLEVTFEDYNSVEKIAYLPEEQELFSDENYEGYDPEPGDFCLYAPWGNLSLFYEDFGYSDGLIPIGKVESAIEEIGKIDHDFSVKLSRVN